jgi:hypothetical protein
VTALYLITINKTTILSFLSCHVAKTAIIANGLDT